MNHSRLQSFLRLSAFLVTASNIASTAANAQTTNAAAAPVAASSSYNLVSDGDFQLAQKDPTWPDDWGHGKGGISYETENGKHFLRLTQTQPGATIMEYREIKVPDGAKTLQIKFNYRTANVVAGEQNWMNARAMFHFLNAARQQIKPEPGVVTFSTSATTWTDATEECLVPDGAKTLVLMPCLFKAQSGTLDLDDVSVTVLN